MNRRGKLLVSRSLHFPSRFPSCTIQNLSQNCLDMRCFTLPSGRRHIDCCQTALRWRVRHLHLVGGGPPPRPSGQSIGVIPPARVVARTIYSVSSFHLLLFRGKMFSSFSNCGVTVFVTSTTLFSESCKCRNISTASCTHIPPHFLASQILRPAPYRYIDADVHHGDGVEEAFAYDRGVFSLSFHRHGPGFFPGTGDLPDVEAAVDDGDDDGAFLLFAFIVIDKMPAFD